MLVGRKLGLDSRRLRVLRYGAMLYDVGKTGVPGARDGVRYPGYFGLAGEAIPEEARILSVVDAFDAMAVVAQSAGRPSPYAIVDGAPQETDVA